MPSEPQNGLFATIALAVTITLAGVAHTQGRPDLTGRSSNLGTEPKKIVSIPSEVCRIDVRTAQLR
jgi:hypothetical protein